MVLGLVAPMGVLENARLWPAGSSVYPLTTCQTAGLLVGCSSAATCLVSPT
jgi:hypothetical protein